MDSRLNNMNKDGRETNPSISKVLGSRPIPNKELDNFYLGYYEVLEFIANSKGAFGIERKY